MSYVLPVGAVLLVLGAYAFAAWRVLRQPEAPAGEDSVTEQSGHSVGGGTSGGRGSWKQKAA